MFRDLFWNYPYFFSKFFRATSPLPFIFLAFFLGYVVFVTFTSDYARSFVEGRDSNKITEGTVGSLMSTNPMYITQNSVDRDFYALVYEKFLDVDSDGEPVPSIASEWGRSGETEYLFKLYEGLTWHDGSPLTASDIVWNFETSMFLSNSLGEDTYGSALEGVTIDMIDDHTLKFSLEETNATFWEAVSVYMIPKHIYDGVPLNNFGSTKFHSSPVGSGPYVVDSISQRGFSLSAFEDYRDEVSIENYNYLFFDSYDELNSSMKNNELDIVNVFELDRVEDLQDYPFFEIEELLLSNRQRVLYFNNRREIFGDPEIRRALSMLIDRERLLREANVAGVPSNGPIPEDSWAFNDSLDFLEYNPDEATDFFESLGYSRASDDEYYVNDEGRVFALTVAFFESDINKRIIESLKGMFKEGGILLRERPLNYDQVMREVLPTRDFELLLYEIEVTVDPDQYNLWHSLRSDHPMLNISGYSYSRVDILLERARTNLDFEERKEDYFLFQRYLIDDAPVSFLYHPKKHFIFRRDLRNFNTENIIWPSSRYDNVHEWYWNN